MPSYKEYDQETLDKLHKVELEILDDFVRVCKDHKLTYFLTGGTMLGAVRHKGFIPWDDDIDIGMPRKDYDEFMKIGQEAMGDKYYVDAFETNKDFYLPFAKIKMNGTIFDESIASEVEHHKGIYIDIFSFDNVTDLKKFRLVKVLIIRTIVDSMFYRLGMRKFSKLRHKFLTLCCCLIPRRLVMKWQRHLMRLNKNDNSEYIAPLSGCQPYIKEVQPRSVILPVKKIMFEGKEYNGMQDPDTYLKGIYGKYMELPPVEKRVNHMPNRIAFKEDMKDETSKRTGRNKNK